MTRPLLVARRRLPTLVSALVGALVLVLVTDAALAFRPSTRWILDQAADRQLKRDVRSLTVTQETTLFGLETAPRGLTVKKRTWLLAPLSAREETELPEGTEVQVRNAKKALVIRPGQKEVVRRADPDVVTSFLAGGPPLERRGLAEQLFQDLRRLKIDTDVVAYARFDGRVAYLIGSKPWEQEKSQVWIDKDTLQLLRVVLVEKDGDKVVRKETRLLGYGSPEGGSWFPKVIEEWRGDQLVRRSVTRSVQKNETLDRALFDVP